MMRHWTIPTMALVLAMGALHGCGESEPQPTTPPAEVTAPVTPPATPAVPEGAGVQQTETEPAAAHEAAPAE